MGSTKSGGKWPEQRELFRDRRDHLDDQGALRLIQALALDVPRPRNHRSVVAVQNVQTAGATELNDAQVNQVNRRPNAEAQGERGSG